MTPRTLLPDNASDAMIIASVDRWAALLEAEQYQAEFGATEHDPAMGWTSVAIEFHAIAPRAVIPPLI